MTPTENDVRWYYGTFGTINRTIKAMREDGFSFGDHVMRKRIKEIEAEYPTHRPARQQLRKSV